MISFYIKNDICLGKVAYTFVYIPFYANYIS